MDESELRSRASTTDWDKTLSEFAQWLSAVVAVSEREPPFPVALPDPPPNPAFYLAARIARGWRWRDGERRAFEALGLPDSERGAWKLAILERAVRRAFSASAPARERRIMSPIAGGGYGWLAGDSGRLLDQLAPALRLWRLTSDGELDKQSRENTARALLQVFEFLANGVRDVLYYARRLFLAFAGSDDSEPDDIEFVSLDELLRSPSAEEATPPSPETEALASDLEQRTVEQLRALELRGLYPLGREFFERRMRGEDVSMEDVAKLHRVTKQAVQQQVQKVRAQLRSLFR